ncbi:hypothetical protein GH733_004133 [Mirounga leonina]|nr:hypothetical protein GH733_004133 [Mirounga leonina]
MNVKQSPSTLSLQEGASSTLKCNFSDILNSVQWFRQNPGGGGLTSLFYIVSGMKQSGRLNCTVNAKERSSTLHITASQLEDSATYLCAVEAQCSLVIQGEKVEQHPSTLSVQQGSSSVINCSYSDSTSNYFPWYKQELGKGPQLLIYVSSSMAKKEDQRLTVFLNRTAKRFSLHIKDTQPEDSAVYFCSASTHCFPGTCCLHSNLQLGQPAASTDHFSVTPMFLHGKNEERYLGDPPEMKCFPGFVTVVLLMLGQTHGDSVTQTEGQMTLSEEAFLTINCTYSTTGYPTLFWYIQYPGEGPELLLKASRDKEKGSKKGFEVTYDRDSKSFHLQKGSVQASDSAVYYCVMMNVQPHKLFRDPWWVLLCLMTSLDTHSVPEKVVMPNVFLTEYDRRVDGRASVPNQDLLEKEGKGGKEEHYLGDTPEMKCSPGFMTVVLLMLGQTHGDSVTQMEGPVTLSEEDSLTINCTYTTTSYPTLLWYVQYPGEGPELLLKASRDKEKASKKGFESTYDRDSKSFHLEKGSVQASDSAVYYCALSDTRHTVCLRRWPLPSVFLTEYGRRVDGRASAPNQGLLEKEGREERRLSQGIGLCLLFSPGVSGKNQVEQNPPSLVILEGENCTIQCNYTVDPFSNLRWYKQGTERGPAALIFVVYSGSKTSDGRYTTTLDTTSKHSSLHITAAQLSDSAFYICAVSALCSLGTCSQYLNLHLQVVKEASEVK